MGKAVWQGVLNWPQWFSRYRRKDQFIFLARLDNDPMRMVAIRVTPEQAQEIIAELSTWLSGLSSF